MTGKREFFKTFYELPQMTTPVMAQVFGAIFRFCEMRENICRASKETLSQLTGYNRKTIRENINKLIDGGWIIDLTPDERYKPHKYTITESARDFIETSGTLAPDSGTFAPMSDTLGGTFGTFSGTESTAQWNRGYPKEKEFKREKEKRVNKNNNSAAFSLNAEHLMDALILIQESKSKLMQDILNKNKDIEYTDNLERAVECHWCDMVYYFLDGRQVNAGDFINTDNILELYHSASMAFMEPAFYETMFSGNYEVGLR